MLKVRIILKFLQVLRSWKYFRFKFARSLLCPVSTICVCAYVRTYIFWHMIGVGACMSV